MTEEKDRARPFRWQALFQGASDSIFVLDQRCRLLFFNQACEQLTGMRLDEVRGLLCRRRQPVRSEDTPEELLAHLFTPPAEARAGKFARIRRLYAVRSRRESTPVFLPRWWDVEFLPIRKTSSGESHFLLGRILPLPIQTTDPGRILPEKLVMLRHQQWQWYTFDRLQSVYPEMQRVQEQARLAATLTVPALISGPQGSGKRTLARILHGQGPRAEHSFVALDCRLLTSEAVADVLDRGLGVQPGRPTGTLYVIEPGCLTRDLQARIRDLLVDAAGRPESARMLFACSSPELQVKEGKLLDDLYWRISPLTIELIALARRRNDLRCLVESMLARIGAIDRLERWSQSVWEAFESYPWPGNLRELREVLVGLLADNQGETIDLSGLPFVFREYLLLATDPPPVVSRQLNLDETLVEVEKRLILLALTRTAGNRKAAADLLGMHRAKLLRRIDQLQLDVPSEKKG